MNKHIILKVQGLASSKVEDQLSLPKLKNTDKIIVLTGLSEFTVSSSTTLKVFDLKNNMDIGEVEFLEVYLPRNRNTKKKRFTILSMVFGFPFN